MNGDERLFAIVRDSVALRTPLARYRPVASRHAVDGDLVLSAAGRLGPEFNNVAVLGEVPPPRLFAVAERFFAGTGGYSVTVVVERAAAIEQALLNDGWRLDEEEPALVLTPLPEHLPPPPAGLTINRVTTHADLDAFRSTGRTPQWIVPTLAAATDPDVALFTGAVNGQVIATARLTCLGAIAEITGVVTEPGQRRRGIGTAMTWAAIAAGAARGCTSATLTATEMGYPVYLKMGFQPVCTFRTYLPAA